MKPRICIPYLLCLATLTVAGCSTSPRVQAYLDTLNSEKRGLEDRIYALEYDLEIVADELAEVQERNEELKRQLGPEPDKSPSPKRTSAPVRTPRRKPSETLESLPDHPRIDLGTPEIDLGTPAKAPLSPAAPKVEPTPPTKRSSANLRAEPKAQSRAKPIAIPKSSSESGTPLRSNTATLAPVTQLYLNPFLTGAADFDGQPGDDGVTVVLEPRSAAGEYVPLAGPISVVLLDAEKTGAAARVAKWDLDVVEASRFVKNSDTAQGLHLQLAWPQRPPQNPRLRMFVRYTTPDGQKLQAEQDIFVTFVDQVSSRWTPKGKRSAISAGPSTSEMAESPAADAPALDLVAPAQADSATHQAQRPRPAWRPNR